MTINKRSIINFSRLAKYSIIFSIFPALFIAMFPGKIAIVTIVCSYPLIVFLLFSLNKQHTKKIDGNVYVLLFLIYNLFILIRGFFDANSFEDWKVLLSTMVPLFLFVHFSIYLAAYKASLVAIMSAFLSYGLILCLFIFIIPVNNQFGFPKAISPIYFIVFMIPYLGKKFMFFILSIVVVSFFSDVANRSNLLNIIISLMILSSFLYKNKAIMLFIIKLVRRVLLISPVLFLILGVSGIFNIFLIGEDYSDLIIETENGVSQEAFVDSRTPIFTDVFSELVKEDSILFGLGASGKTDTFLTDSIAMDFSEIYKEGRRGTESGLLNYIQWGGIIGGLLYFLLFVKASYYGIYKSKNWFCIMLGLFMAFKGLFSLIEDRLTFSIESIFIFISIGICFNKKVRQMSDLELRLMFRYILKKTVILRFLISKKQKINLKKIQVN